MIQDHGKAGDLLTDLARQAGIVVPDELDPEHKMIRAELEKSSGLQFGLAYMRGQIVEHQNTVQLFEWEINSGQDADIQRFASETLPTIFAHLQMAQDIVTRLTGQVPQGAAPGAALAMADQDGKARAQAARPARHARRRSGIHVERRPTLCDAATHPRVQRCRPSS